MDFSAFIGASAGYAVLALAPPVVWLLVYLKEDEHKEPFRLILLAFAGGIAAAFAALALQSAFLKGRDLFENAVFLFSLIAVSEEFFKFAAVRLLIVNRRDFNEPIDAMIYMVSAGLGFAAVENLLFLFSYAYTSGFPLSENLLAGAHLSAARFIGANQLHALASGVMGYFMARAFFFPNRKWYIPLGLLFASLLHGAFNYLIIMADAVPASSLYLFGILSTALVIVLIDFQKLKRYYLTVP